MRDDDQPVRSQLYGPNVPRNERIASAVLGGALAAFGIGRRSIFGAALAAAGGALILRGASGRCPLYRMRAVRKGITVRRAVTVQASPREIYDAWRDLRNLPRFMDHVKSVELEPGGVSHWTLEVGKRKLDYRAEIVEDTPGRRLRWRSLPGGDLEHEGSLDLHEAPGDRGTVVEVKLRYQPPGGRVVAGVLGGMMRKLSGMQLSQELARLRMWLETGELATGARNPGELLGEGMR